jgi:peptide/nickel transport system substrate-binding protein
MEIANRASPNDLNDVVSQGHFDVVLLASSRIPRVWSAADHYETKGLLNHQHYSNVAVDAALGIAETEYAEPTQLDALGKADRLLADDLVSLPLFQVPIMWAYAKNIDSVYRQASEGVTWNANEWNVS